MSTVKYDPMHFRCMSPCRLIEQLDFLVRDPADPDYLALKAELQKLAKKAANRNPFNAGRPERFLYQEKLEMAGMKENGSTYREIAEYYECSTSLVYRCIDEIEAEKRRNKQASSALTAGNHSLNM